MVYALMTGKSKECYAQLFQELIALAEESNLNLDPPLILTDFEQAAISAVQDEFPDSLHKGCFFTCARVFGKKFNH